MFDRWEAIGEGGGGGRRRRVVAVEEEEKDLLATCTPPPPPLLNEKFTGGAPFAKQWRRKFTNWSALFCLIESYL